MPYKRNTKFTSVGNLVNVLATVTVFFLISTGYVSALAGLPITI